LPVKLLNKKRAFPMPTYEYQCRKCGHRFELFQSIKDRPRKSCIRPGCRGRVQRLLGTGAGMIFKGPGFYITDYRKPGYKDAAKKDAPTTTSATPTAPDTGGAAAKKPATKD
jgi:putative FmdB family regulatory protein